MPASPSPALAPSAADRPAKKGPAPARRTGPGWRYRADVAARALLAILGGYAVAALWDAALAVVLPGPPAEAAVTGTLLSFLIYAGAVMGVFCTRSAARAALALGLAALPPAVALVAWFQPGVAS